MRRVVGRYVINSGILTELSSRDIFKHHMDPLFLLLCMRIDLLLSLSYFEPCFSWRMVLVLIPDLSCNYPA